MDMILSNQKQLVQQDGFSAFCRMAESYPFLSEEEEKEKALAFRKFGDQQAAMSLVLSHLRLVAKIARDHKGYGLPLEDLTQEGTVGLMKAVKGYNPDIGRLASYAILWIKSEIQEYILENWRLVKIGSTKALKKLFFGLRQVKESLGLSFDHSLKTKDFEAVAQSMDVKTDDVAVAEAWFDGQVVSIDLESDEKGSVIDVLADQNPTPEMHLIELDKEQYVKNRVEEVLKNLDDREMEILKGRLWTDKKMTLAELATSMGVSVERVRQLETTLKKKMALQLSDLRDFAH